jgi:DNA anti-recombination protein RmuC
MDPELKSVLEAMETRLRENLRDSETHLRQYIDESETRLREYVGESETRLREYVDESETRLREHIGESETRLREYIDERTHDSETRIVRAFGAYQESASVRMRKIEADLSNVNSSTTQQMDSFQSKLLELETRIIALERPQASA